MAMNAFISFKGAPGESVQEGFKDTIELQTWSWEITAESSWTKGGGAAVGKPNPGELQFAHYFDRASPVMMAYMCQGKHFEEVTITLCKTTGKATPEAYLTMLMKGCYVTSISNEGGEDGSVNQTVKFVFKTINIDYKQQDNMSGALKAAGKFTWDIPAMKASN